MGTVPNQVGLDYLVLRCADLERSRAFYEALGIQLVPEQHGRGHPHYSGAVGSVVLELYPLSGKPTSGARLGIRVSDLAAIVEAMNRIGAEVVRVGTESAPDSVVLRDPDGHEIAVTQYNRAPAP